MIRKGEPQFDSGRHKRILEAYVVRDRKLYTLCGVQLWHEFDAAGNHRLCFEERRVGEWVGYQAIAVLRMNQGKFGAVTEYHSHPEMSAVFKIVEQ